MNNKPEKIVKPYNPVEETRGRTVMPLVRPQPTTPAPKPNNNGDKKS